MVVVELVVVAVSSGGSAKSVFKVSYIVCSVICWSVSGCTVCSVMCLSVSNSNGSSSSVTLYVSIVLNLGLSVLLQVAVLRAGVSLEQLAGVVIVNAAAVVTVDAVVVISDAKYVVVVISVYASVVARVVGVVEVVVAEIIEFLG